MEEDGFYNPSFTAEAGGGLVVLGFGGACSNCIHGHRMGMIIQRCSSPQHLRNEAQNADLLAVSMNTESCHHR